MCPVGSMLERPTGSLGKEEDRAAALNHVLDSERGFESEVTLYTVLTYVLVGLGQMCDESAPQWE